MTEFQINERIKLLIEKLHLTPYQFAKDLNLKRPDVVYNIINKRNGVSNRIIRQIVEKFKINNVWLLTGEGEMIKKDNNLIEEPLSDYTQAHSIKSKNISEDYQSLLKDFSIEKTLNNKLKDINAYQERKIIELEYELNRITEICKKCDKCKLALENGTIQTSSG